MKRLQGSPKVLAALVLFASPELFAEDQRAKADRILISLADRTLSVILGDEIVRTYDVAIGKPSTPTPSGEFQIINRLVNPTYYGTNVVVAPGPANPLGVRWMGLSVKGYGIHGTNRPDSIGKAASHGCIRMKQADLEELFEMVSIGTPVELTVESLVVVN